MMMMWSKHRPLLVLISGAVLIAGAVLGGFLLFGGNNDGRTDVGEVVKEKIPSVSTAGSVGGQDNVTRLSPAEASFNLEELPAEFDYEVDVANTFAMNLSTFASSYWFDSGEEGEAKAREWGITNGFQVYYQPKGLFASVLDGVPYVTVETYQFEDTSGSRKAFGQLNNVLKNTPGSEAVEARPLANDSAAYRFLQGTVGPSEKLAVYHRYAFRRGNSVVVVQTWGADEYMNIDPARNIAAEIDNKLLGSRPAVEPTPLPTPDFSGGGGR
jgi:hypothetical protein